MTHPAKHPRTTVTYLKCPTSFVQITMLEATLYLTVLYSGAHGDLTDLHIPQQYNGSLYFWL